MDNQLLKINEANQRPRDFRYSLLPNGILSGKIKTIGQVLKLITRSALARDLYMDKKTLDIRLADPSKWTVGELNRMTVLFGVPLTYVMELVLGRPLNENP